MTRWFLILVLGLAGQYAAAAGCLSIAGDTVTAADVAAALTGFRAVPASVVLGYTPAPGARRVFSAAQLVRIAGQHGIVLQPAADICVERAARHLQEDELLDAMRRALASEARLSLQEFSKYPVPVGEVVLPFEGLPATAPNNDGPVLWKGYVRYATRRRFPVWARVAVLVPTVRLQAVRDLPAGVPIDASHVQVTESWAFPSKRSVAGPEQVAGRAPRRLIPAGAEVVPSMLEAVRLVVKGEKVRVEARSGSAHLSLEARAETAGDAGDVISVRNLQSGRLFSARVRAKGEVVVLQE